MKPLTMTAAALVLSGAATLAPSTANAQNMWLSQTFLMAGNFCPRGSSEAAGQLVAITQNEALFALVGTMYGGDGRTTFALPDLRGRVPLSVGQGPGLSNYVQGQKAGVEAVPLITHSHSLNAVSENGNTNAPAGNFLANDGNDNIYNNTGTAVQMNGGAIGSAGTAASATNLQPSLAMRWCIVTNGIFPPRN